VAALQALVPSSDGVVSGVHGSTDDVSGALEAAQALAASRCNDLPALYELAKNTESFVVSLRGELSARTRAVAECMHADRLCADAGLRIQSVPHDGDCFFTCAHSWLSQRTDEPVSDAELEDAAATPEATARVERALAALTCTSATEVRALVVQTLRDLAASPSDECAVSVVDGISVAESIEATVATACSGAPDAAPDATSSALRAALDRHRTSADDTDAARATAYLEAYLEVMGTRGIYGERLEIFALSALTRSPVHLYYFLETPDTAPFGGAPAEEVLGGAAPTEVVLAPGVAADAEPLRLLHRVCDRHFDLLLSGAAGV
jgi:hypothetical protein